MATARHMPCVLLCLLLASCAAIPGGPREPVQVLWTKTLSTDGSTRGTAYAMSNKIITAAGLVFVAWLDHVADVRIRTYDLATERWGETLLLGRGIDNHSGPALTMDAEGYLYAIFGPHGRGPFQLRRSLLPFDASAWTPVEEVGANATYPSLVCDPDGTLHLTYRGHPSPARLMYQRRPRGGEWSEPQALVSADVPDGYTQFGNPLAVSADGTLHLGFHVYDVHPKAGKAAGYLRSRDHGVSWETAAGEPVTLPAAPSTPCFIEQGESMDVRVSNVAVDPEGRPHLVVVHKETELTSATLWCLDEGEWRSTALLPFVHAVAPGRGLEQTGTVSFDARGRLHIALVTQDPPGGWGHPSGEVILLTSDDRGATFDALPISPADPTLPAWLPSLERPFGAQPLAGVPALLYTRGGPGEGLTGGDATEIVFVRLGPDS